ncbi:MAG: hypothetical protein AAF645_08180, partial [Myxococcota bacterium]
LKAAEKHQDLLIAIDRELGEREGEAKTELLREVARIWHYGLKNPYEAKDAWNRVLRESPNDSEAREALSSMGEKKHIDTSEVILPNGLDTAPERTSAADDDTLAASEDVHATIESAAPVGEPRTLDAAPLEAFADPQAETLSQTLALLDESTDAVESLEDEPMQFQAITEPGETTDEAVGHDDEPFPMPDSEAPAAPMDGETVQFASLADYASEATGQLDVEDLLESDPSSLPDFAHVDEEPTGRMDFDPSKAHATAEPTGRLDLHDLIESNGEAPAAAFEPLGGREEPTGQLDVEDLLESGDAMMLESSEIQLDDDDDAPPPLPPKVR